MEVPGPDSERIEALTESNVGLLKRVELLEKRLARVERLTGTVEEQEPAPAIFAPPPIFETPHVPPPLPVAEEAPQHPSVPEIPAFARSAEPPAAPPEKQQLETRMGLTWVNRIGVITLIIGVAFFFKYAIDNQWIGETGRVVLGVLAGLVTLAAGDILWRRNQQVFAQGVCGLGVSILYLSFYASFGFYHLLPQAAAFFLMVMTTAMAGALALRYNAVAIAALGMLGGYATPVLLTTHQDAPWTFFSYLFLIDAGAVAIARPRKWRSLDLMAFIATAILYLGWFGDWFRTDKHLVATVALLAFYALFAFVDWAWIFYASQVLAGIALTQIWPDTTPYLMLSLAVGAAGLVVADAMRRPMAASFSFATFWATYWIWKSSQGEPEEIGTVFLALTVAFVMYVVWTPFQKLVRGVEIRTQHLTVLGLNGAVYFAYSYLLLSPHYKGWMGLFAAAVAGVHLLLGMQLWKERAAAGRDMRPVLLALGIALGFLTLAVPIQFNGFSITLSWAMEAAALVWISRRTNETRILLGALAVYVLVFARLFAFDATLSDEHRAMLMNTRFLVFIVSAISFWLGAWWLKANRPAAAVLYVTGHLIMLSSCFFEITDWIRVSASPENIGSLTAIGVSILMAVYAVVLISIGVGMRRVLDRVLGLGLIGMVVVKLYLYDVWEVSRLFRTVAFVALGVLLLLTSYLYSRFRPAIESLWRDEEART